jgi:hypothetical protein
MPAILSTIVLPAVTKGPGAFSRLLNTACDGIAGYLGRRTSIACLRDLDDRPCGTLAWPVSGLRRLSTVSSRFPAKRNQDP